MTDRFMFKEDEVETGVTIDHGAIIKLQDSNTLSPATDSDSIVFIGPEGGVAIWDYERLDARFGGGVWNDLGGMENTVAAEGRISAGGGVANEVDGATRSITYWEYLPLKGLEEGDFDAVKDGQSNTLTAPMGACHHGADGCSSGDMAIESIVIQNEGWEIG